MNWNLRNHESERKPFFLSRFRKLVIVIEKPMSRAKQSSKVEFSLPPPVSIQTFKILNDGHPCWRGPAVHPPNCSSRHTWRSRCEPVKTKPHREGKQGREGVTSERMGWQQSASFIKNRLWRRNRKPRGDFMRSSKRDFYKLTKQLRCVCCG